MAAKKIIHLPLINSIVRLRAPALPSMTSVLVSTIKPTILVISIFMSGFLCAQDIANAKDLFQQRQFDQAEMILQGLKKQLKKNPDKNIENQMLYWLGRVYFEQGNAEEAKDALESAIEIKPNTSEEYYWLGRAYSDLAPGAGVFKQISYAGHVRDNFELAEQSDPSNLQARRGLFAFYIFAPSVMGGSVEKAENELQEIRKLSPMDADIQEIGLLQKKKQDSLALDRAQHLITQYPNSAEALYVAAMTIRKQPRFDDEAQEKQKMQSAIFNFERASKVPLTNENRQYVEGGMFSFAETCSWINFRTDEAIDVIQKLLVSKSNLKNFNKSWPTWTLAKLYKNKSDMEKFHSIVKQIDESAIKKDGALKRDMERHGAI